MVYKLQDGRIVPALKNGYVGDSAISNLPQYFADNPEIAKAHGYYQLVRGEPPEVLENQYAKPEYALVDGAIVESWVVVDLPPITQEN